MFECVGRAFRANYGEWSLGDGVRYRAWGSATSIMTFGLDRGSISIAQRKFVIFVLQSTLSNSLSSMFILNLPSLLLEEKSINLFWRILRSCGLCRLL
jgi:hypothetical protein